MVSDNHGVTSMPRKRPPFVELWRDRHGKVRVYFRKDRGPRLPLPNAIGSDEFNAAYQAALLGQPAPVRDRFVRAAPGTIAALIASYRRARNTSAFVTRRRRVTSAGLRRCAPQHGHRTVAGLSRERIITGHFAALRGSARRRALDPENASRSNPPRHQHRMAQA